MLGGYDAFEDPYSYQGTDCLRNRAGIRDAALLSAFELEMSTLRAEEPLPNGRFGAAHYRRVHWHLFRDVYSWAGRYRTVWTAKSGNWFCTPENIDAELTKLLRVLQNPPFNAGSAAGEFIPAAADFLAELNAIHAFREGNGRAQLAFMHLVALRAGHPLDFRRIRRESFLPAMIESYHRRLDSLIAELEALRA